MFLLPRMFSARLPLWLPRKFFTLFDKSRRTEPQLRDVRLRARVLRQHPSGSPVCAADFCPAAPARLAVVRRRPGR